MNKKWIILIVVTIVAMAAGVFLIGKSYDRPAATVIKVRPA